MLTFDFGVYEIYDLATVFGFGIPAPWEMLTDAVLILFLVPFDGGFTKEFLIEAIF